MINMLTAAKEPTTLACSLTRSNRHRIHQPAYPRLVHPTAVPTSLRSICHGETLPIHSDRPRLPLLVIVYAQTHLLHRRHHKLPLVHGLLAKLLAIQLQHLQIVDHVLLHVHLPPLVVLGLYYPLLHELAVDGGRQDPLVCLDTRFVWAVLSDIWLRRVPRLCVDANVLNIVAQSD